MYDELIKKLREKRHYETNLADLQLCMQAADVIEQQNLKIEHLKKELKRHGVFMINNFYGRSEWLE